MSLAADHSMDKMLYFKVIPSHFVDQNVPYTNISSIGNNQTKLFYNYFKKFKRFFW